MRMARWLGVVVVVALTLVAALMFAVWPAQAAPAVELSKVSSAGGAASPGDVVDYTITITNSDVVPVTVSVRDDLPSQVQYVAGSATVGSPLTYGDDFESDSYSGNTGTAAWSGPWVETNDIREWWGGDLVIEPDGGSNRLRLRAALKAVERPADTSSMLRPTLRFQRKLWSVESSDWFYLDVYDGAVWHEGVLAWSIGSTQDVYLWEETDLSAYKSASMAIRFRTNASVGTGDVMYVDDVEIFDAGEPLAAPPVMTTTLLVEPGAVKVVELSAVVQQPLGGSTLMTNTAKLAGDVTLEDSVLDILQAPILQITKEMTPTVVEAGEEITYTVRVTNTGTLNATNVSIYDPVPLYTDYVGGSVHMNSLPLDIDGAPGPRGTLWGAEHADVVRARLASEIAVAGVGAPPWILTGHTLTPGQAVTVIFTVDTQTPLTNGLVITNTASVTCTEIITPVSASTATLVHSSPNLSVSKYSENTDPPPLNPGDIITYTITIINSGNGNATQTVVSDTLPSHTTFIPGSVVISPPSAGGTPGTPHAIASGVSVPGNNGVTTVKFAALVDKPLPNGTVLTNTVAVNCIEDLTWKTAQVVDTVVSAPYVAVTKSSQDMTGGAPLRPGDVLSYTVVLENVGTMDYNHMNPPPEFLDYLPLTNASYVGGSETASSGTISFVTDHIRWDGNLLVGQPVTLTFAIQLNTPLNDGTTISNFGTAQYDSDGDGDYDGLDIPTQSNTVVDTVTASPDIVITKESLDTNGGSLEPGDRLRYTITFTNTGDMDATDMVLTDTIPAYTTFYNRGTPPGGGTVVSTSPEIRIEGIDLASGASDSFIFRVNLDSVIPVGTHITNRAYVFYDSDGTGGNDTLSQSNQTSDLVTSSPQITVTKHAHSATVVPGQPVTYTIVMTNNGNAPATSVSVSDTLSSELTFVPGSITIEPVSAGGTPGTPPAVATGMTVNVGTPVTVTFAATVSRPLTNTWAITNTAGVTSAEVPTPTLSPPEVVTVNSAPLVTGSKSVQDLNGGPLQPGDRLRYTIVITNSGTMNQADNTGPEVWDPIPAGTTYVSGSASASSGTVGYNGGLARVEWNGLLNVDQPVTITFDVDLDVALSNGTMIANVGNVDWDSDGDNTNNATFTVNADIGPVISAPVMVAHKTSLDLDGGVFEPGDVISYTVVITNIGNMDQPDLPSHFEFYDPIFPGLTYHSGSATQPYGFWGIDATTVKWTGPITVNQPLTLTWAMDVGNISHGTVVTNAAEIRYDSDGDGDWDSNDTVTVTNTTEDTIYALALLSATKASADKTGGPPLEPGDVIRYTIIITNTGNYTVTGAVFTDTVPANTTFLNVPTLPGGAVNNSTASEVNISNITVPAYGGSATIEFRVRVNLPLTNGTVISNQGYVRYDRDGLGSYETIVTDDPTTPALGDPTEDTVTSAPGLAVGKTSQDANGGNLEPSDVLTYSIAITNTGTENAFNVAVYDEVPAHTTFVPGSIAVEPLSVGGTIGSPPNLVSGMTITAQTTATVTFAVTLDTPLDNGTAISNTATVSADLVSPVSATITDTVTSAPIGVVSKTGTDVNGGSVVPGDRLNYQFVLSNVGDMDQWDNAGDEVWDVLSPYVTYVPSLVASSGTAVYDGVNHRIEWNGSVPAGESVTVTYSVDVNFPVDNGTSIDNTVYFTYDSDGNGTNDTNATASKSFTVVSAPLVQAVKSSQDMNGFPLRPSDVLSYTVVLENVGDMDYHDQLPPHEFSDWLPLTDASFVTSSEQASSGTIAYSGGEIIWDGDLLVGQPVTLSFAIQLNTPLANGTNIVNSGTVYYDTDADGSWTLSDTPLSTNTVTDTVTSAAVIVMTKEAVDSNGGSLEPGDRLRYTITFTNTGDMDAADMVLTDTIPAHTTYYNNGGAPGGGTIVSTSPEIRIEGIDLTAGSSDAFIFRVDLDSVIPVGTSILNRAYIAYDSDGDTVNEALAQSNQTSDAVTSAPVLSIAKSVTNPGGAPHVPGDTLRYTLVLNNSGNAPAENTVISDTLDSNTTFANNVTIDPVSAGGTPGTPPNIVTGLTVDVGSPVTVTFDVTINRPTPDGTVIKNRASVTALGASTPVLSNQVARTVSSPTLVVSKQSEPDTVMPGQTMTYTIGITNAGSVTANDLTIMDMLPPYVTYVPGSARLAVPTTYGDDFSTGDYTGSTGNASWAMDWTESGDDGSPTTGNIVVGLSMSDLRLIVRGNGVSQIGVYREADTSAFVAPRLVFDRKLTSMESGDAFYLLVWDGSAWQTAYTWSGPADESNYSQQVIDLTPYKASDMTINFHTSAATASDDLLLVDNIWIYDAGSPLSAPPTMATGLTLPSSQSMWAVLNVAATTPLTNGMSIVNEARASCYEMPTPVSGFASSTVSSTVSLTGTKSSIDVNGGDLTPGDTLRYQIVLTATGDGVAADTSINDPLPANTSWQSNVTVTPASAGGTPGSPPGVLAGLSVAGGSTVTVTYDVQIDSPLAEGTVITNTATISSPHIPSAFSSTVTDTVHTALLSISKSADPTVVEAGGVVTYIITVQNTGATTATNVMVTDTLPPEVTYIPGSSHIASAFTFADDFASGGYSGSTGTHGWATPWGESGDDGSPATGDVTVVSEGGSLRLHVSGSSNGVWRDADNRSMLYPVLEFDRKFVSVESGDTFDLQVYNGSAWTTVQNWSGPADESGYTHEVIDLTGYKASNFSIRFGSGAANASDDHMYIDNVLVYDAGVTGNAPPVLTDTLSIGPGMAMNVSFQGNVTKPLENGSTITNRAGASSQQVPTPVTAELVSTVSSAPDVWVTKTSFDPSGSPLHPDELLNYQIVLNNLGTMNQHDNADFELVDAIPVDASYVSGSLFFTSGAGAYNAGLDRIEWNGAVDVGQPVTISFSIRTDPLLPNGTPIYNLAVLNFDSDGDNVNDQIRGDSTTDLISSSPFVVAHKTSLDEDGSPLRPGDVISYTVVFTNVGDMDQVDKTGAEFLDDIPEHSTYVTDSAWTSVGSTWYNGTYDRVAWSGDLPAGLPVTVKFAVEVTSPLTNGTPIENTGRIFYDADGDGTTNEAVALAGPITDTVISSPKIEITKAAVDVNGAPLEPGDILRYDVTIENTGDMNAENMVFTDMIPAHTTFLTVANLPPGAVVDTTSPQLRITGLDVAAGSPVTFRVRVQIDLPLLNGTAITNQGLLEYDSDGDGINESLEPTDDPDTPAINDPTVVTVTSAPLLEVVKTSTDLNGAPLGPNDLLEYQVVIHNAGTANATNVVVSDTVPVHTTWQDALTINPPSAGGVTGAPPILVTGMTVVAQESVTLTYRVQVQASVADGTPIENKVEVQCAEDPTWRSATLTDTAYAPILEVAKTGEPNPVEAGDVLTYTIWVTNTGGYPTGNLSVADTLPSAVAYVPGSTVLAVTTTYADDFESNDYTGSTGTHDWGSNWVESGGDGGPLSGDVEIVTESASKRLHVTGVSKYARRTADLTPFLKPTLKFDRKLVSLDSGSDYFRVEAWNGSAWTTLYTWYGPADDADYLTETFDLSAYIISDARIRFRSGASNTTDDHLYVDNVVIYDAGVSGGAPPVLGTGLTLQPHTTLLATFQVLVDSPLPDGTVLVNTGSVTSQHFPVPITAVAINNVHSAPDLSVDKTSLDVNGDMLSPYDVLRYQVVIRNDGNQNATQVNLFDELPTYTTWVGNVSISPVSAGGVPGSPPNVATGMTVRGGESVTVTYEVRVQRPIPDGTLVVNTASVSSLEAPGPYTDDVTDTVHSPTLLVQKSGSPQPVEAGGTVDFVIGVTNTGSLAATGVVVTDTLPPEIAYVPGTAFWKLEATYADTFSIYSYSEHDGTVHWASDWTEQSDDGLPASGKVGLVWDDGSLRLNLNDANGAIWREADVSYFYTPRLRFNYKIAGLEAGKAFYLDVYNGSSWQVAHTWFGPIDQGSYAQATFDLSAYQSASTRIRFRAGTTLDSGDNLYVDNVEIYDQEQPAGAPPNLVMGATLPTGAGLTARFSGQVASPLPSGTLLPNTGWARCTEWPVGVSSTFNSMVHSTTAVQVTKTSQDVNGGNLEPGDVLRYQVVLENVGNQNQGDNAGNEMVDAIPAHTTYVPGSAVATSGSVVYNAGAVRVDWNGPVNVGQPVTVTFDVQVDNGLANGTQIVNQATSYYDADGNGSNEATVQSNTTQDTIASHVTIMATKVSEDLNGGLLEPEDVIEYTIGITNTGNMDMLDAPAHEFEDDIPAHATYVGGSAWASSGTVVFVSGTTVQWDGALPAGDSVTIQFSVQVEVGAANNTLISNQGEINYDSNGDGQVDGSDTPHLTDDPRVAGPANPTEDRVGYAPLLEATKISVDQNGGFLEPGDRLIYTIVLRNIGNASLVNNVDAEFLDDIPAFTTYVIGSADATVGSVTLNPSNTVLRWDGQLDPGQAAAITFHVDLGSPLAHMTPICNQGTVYYDADGNGTNESTKPTDDPRTPEKDDPTCDAVVSGPILSMSKSSVDTDGGDLLPKDLLRYTVTISNTGNDAAHNVTISDTLPPEVAWLGSVDVTPPSAGGTPGTPPIVASGIEVAAGETVTVSFLTRVNSPLPNGTVITNTAAVTADQVVDPISDTVVDVVVSDHYLELSKVGQPKPVEAGGLLTYVLAYEVIGDEPAPSAVITDTVPANTTFVSASGGVAPVGGVLTWNLGTLSAPTTGEVTFTVQVDAPLMRGTALSNTAYFRDGDGRSASATDTTLVSSDHTLSLAKLDTVDPVQAGGLLTYTLTYSVTGNEPATGILISDGVPAGTTFFSASGGDSIESPPVGQIGMVRWHVAQANPGEVGVVTLVVAVDPSVPNGTTLMNWATITDAQGKGATDSESTVVQNTDISIDKTVEPATVKSGDVVTYTINYLNVGPASALNVRITDTLPSGLTYGGMVFMEPGVVGPSQIGQDLVWSVGLVPASASSQLVFTATVDPTSETDRTLTNWAGIGTSTAERNYGNNEATASNTLHQEIHVAVDKESSAGGSVQPGAEIEYTIRLTNTGDGLLSGLTVSDAAPANTTFVPGSIVLDPVSAGTPGFAPPTLASNVSIGVGGSVTVRFRVRVNSPLPNGTLIVNTAEASGGGLPAPVSDTVTDTVQSSHTLSLLKIDTPDPVSAGGLLTYTLQYQVMGNEAATSVVLVDELPPHVTVHAIYHGGVKTDNQISWNLNTLLPPASGSVSFVVRVNSPLANGTVLVNTAHISDAQGRSANATASTTVTSAPLLEISKIAPETVRAGDILTYTIIYTNTGEADATSVVVTDTFPAHTEYHAGGDFHTATQVGWNVPVLAAGATDYAVFSVRVLPDTPVGTEILNDQYGIRSSELPAAVGGAPVSSSVAPPTGITLEYFTVRQVGQAVELEWKTSSEVNNWGFHVYRSTAPDFEAATRLNEHLIPGRGRGLSTGATYTFLDETTEPRRMYYYWLEDIDLNGNAQHRELRSINVTVYIPDEGRRYGIRLPLIWR